MTRVLFLKLLRDLRWSLIGIMFLLAVFQFLWARITERILGRIAPFFEALAGLGGLTRENIESVVFEGPGRIIRTVLGGERVSLDSAMDMLSIGYVHPVMQIVFCIWAIGRAAGAIAGEIDRGTMELLLAQPLARSRLVLAHFLVDVVTIPLLCLALWAGNWVGAWAVSPIQVQKPTVSSPLLKIPDPETSPGLRKRLEVRPAELGRALPIVAGLIFGICGLTMWLSAAGRFRWRVMTYAVVVVLLMFMVNVLGQMWGPAEWLRPLTIFYYYQPQQVIQGGGWSVTLAEWNGGKPLADVPMLAVLFGAGLVGYGMALWTLTRRDLPAPL